MRRHDDLIGAFTPLYIALNDCISQGKKLGVSKRGAETAGFALHIHEHCNPGGKPTGGHSNVILQILRCCMILLLHQA